MRASSTPRGSQRSSTKCASRRPRVTGIHIRLTSSASSNAEKRRAPGIYLDESPAALLFKDFPGWAQRATRQFYAEQGVKFTDDQLRSRDEVLGHVRGRGPAARAGRSVLQRTIPAMAAAPGSPSRRTRKPRASAGRICIDGSAPARRRSRAIGCRRFRRTERRHILRGAVKLGISSSDRASRAGSLGGGAGYGAREHRGAPVALPQTAR